MSEGNQSLNSNKMKEFSTFIPFPKHLRRGVKTVPIGTFEMDSLEGYGAGVFSADVTRKPSETENTWLHRILNTNFVSQEHEAQCILIKMDPLLRI